MIENKKVVAIIQARMNSSRLPGKMMMDIDGLPAIQRVYDRVEKSKVDEIIVATTINVKDLELIRYLVDHKINHFIGSEIDVLGRVFKAAKFYKTDIVVDITGDCPLIDYKQINSLLDIYKKRISGKLKYLSNCRPTRSWPDGFDIQIYDIKLLSFVNSVVQKRYHRVHSGWNILKYMRQDWIYCYQLEAIGKYFRPDIGLTLDEKKDLILIDKIYKHFENDDFSTEDVIDYVLRNPELLKINEGVLRKVAGEG